MKGAINKAGTATLPFAPFIASGTTGHNGLSVALLVGKVLRKGVVKSK